MYGQLTKSTCGTDVVIEVMLLTDHVKKVSTNEALKPGRLGDFMKKITSVHKSRVYMSNDVCEVLTSPQVPCKKIEIEYVSLIEEDFDKSDYRVAFKIMKGGQKYDSVLYQRTTARNTHTGKCLQ